MSKLEKKWANRGFSYFNVDIKRFLQFADILGASWTCMFFRYGRILRYGSNGQTYVWRLNHRSHMRCKGPKIIPWDLYTRFFIGKWFSYRSGLILAKKLSKLLSKKQPWFWVLWKHFVIIDKKSIVWLVSCKRPLNIFCLRRKISLFYPQYAHKNNTLPEMKLILHFLFPPFLFELGRKRSAVW